MRNLLGTCDDLQGSGKRVWIGRFGAFVRQLRFGGETLAQDAVGGAALQDALAAAVVGDVEAGEYDFQVVMAVDRDAQDLPLHPPVEALDHAIGFRRVGARLAVHKSAVAPLYLFACLLLGGSAQGAWQNMALQLAGLALIACAAIYPSNDELPR